MKMQITPASDWPITSQISLLDPYYRNPVNVKVVKHANADHIIAEDARGIVYFARTDRIASEPVQHFVDIEFDDFSDILG
ncbi:hypothetical protein D3C80_1464000 [compost metagenome]